MQPRVLHLHTHFLFPFSIDKQAVQEDCPELWPAGSSWLDGVDRWIAAHTSKSAPFAAQLGGWSRTPYTQFDLNSRAYQDMVFFHPIVRRVFFDSSGVAGIGSEKESLLRHYAIPVEGRHLFYEAEDVKGRAAAVPVTGLHLFLFANGIGILSIGVEQRGLPVGEVLWINESLRKIYPSSGRQIREGRVPGHMGLSVRPGNDRQVLVEERFGSCDMIGFLPPLSKTITSLLYFADYDRQEFEPVLDERMIVYSYLELDPNSVAAGYLESEDYQVLLSRFLYVDRWGADYRYHPGFTKRQMARHLYRRWAHQGTYYGFTGYSSVTVTFGTRDCDEHQLSEGFLIHRMFDSRYYLMAVIALFYRATLLDFAERSALISRLVYLDQQDRRLTSESIERVSDLRGEFLHFSNYWHFSELANKDEESEHFEIQCRQYRIPSMKRDIEDEIDKLNQSLHNYFQFRNTEAINRLAMLSLIFGAGAVVTGFFGMNFGGGFAELFFEPPPNREAAHFGAMVIVVVLTLAALCFGLFVVAAYWQDYRDILTLRRAGMGRERVSLKRSP